MKAIFTRFPRKIIGVERNAVSTETRTGIERRKAIGFCFSSVYYLPHVNTHTIAEHRHFVYKADIDVAVRVFENLLHLGHSGSGHARHTAFENRFVYGGDAFEGILANGPNDFGSVLGFVDEIARVNSLGTKAQIEIRSAHKP